MLHPDHLHHLLTHRQVEDWIVYNDIEPFGQPVDDQRTAMTTWAALAPHAGKSTIAIQDCVPRWETPEPLTPEQYQKKAMRRYACVGARLPEIPLNSGGEQIGG